MFLRILFDCYQVAYKSSYMYCHVLFLSVDHGDIIRSGCILCEFDFLLDHREDFTFNVSLHKIATRDSQTYALYALTNIFRYNMVGHSKFCLLLLGGALLFRETLAINQLIGITLTLVGIILYAHVKVNPDCTSPCRYSLFN